MGNKAKGHTEVSVTSSSVVVEFDSLVYTSEYAPLSFSSSSNPSSSSSTM
jgi:hypothetical protein